MPVSARIDDQLAQKLEHWAGQPLDRARHELVEDAMRVALRVTIRRNPVATARSRAAWVASLLRLGRPSPPGWLGPQHYPRAVAEGFASHRFVPAADVGDRTEISVSNDVKYILYLEYGTRSFAPYAMARHGLEIARRQLADLFQFPPT